MNKPDSYFSHEPKIRTQAEMFAVLEKRCAETRGTLTWLEPVKNRDGTGYVKTACGQYSVAKFFVDGEPRYQAFFGKAALGVRKTPEEAKALCR